MTALGERMTPLILASTSRYRAALMARLGVPFVALAPACDEEALKDPRLPPRELALHLARAKATSLVPRHPDAIVVGSDQLVALGDEILGKPGSAERAVSQLLRLSGRTHTLVTALAVARGETLRTHVDVTELTMRPLDTARAERYVAADSPLDCAGAYKLEERGVVLFSRIASADHSAITGLPLIALTDILIDLGVPLP